MPDAPLALPLPEDFRPLGPAGLVLATALALLVIELIRPGRAGPASRGVAAFGLTLAWGTLLYGVGAPGETPRLILYGCLRWDGVVFLGQNVILGLALFFILISPSYLEGRALPPAEYYALMTLAAAAMMLLAASHELLTLFLNLEFVAICFYVLAGLERDNLRSTEAAFKYFLTGAYASAFLLFGISMVYGALGTTRLSEIHAHLEAGALPGLLRHGFFLGAGLSLMLVGFGFKLTLAPFHMYAPDVYAGAPTTVVGFLATGSKVATLAALLNLFRPLVAWADLPDGFVVAIGLLTVASIVVGNVGAVVQTHVKRLLAYSGVAHGGYVLIPLWAAAREPAHWVAAERAVTYYVLAYGLMTALAFGVAATLGPQGESHLDRYAGLARRSPALAAALALALLSLTGVPPTVGFVGKFYLFSVAVDAELYALACFGVLASVASAYYYLKVIVKMYMEEAPAVRAEPVALEGGNAVALILCSAGVLAFALFPMMIVL